MKHLKFYGGPRDGCFTPILLLILVTLFLACPKPESEPVEIPEYDRWEGYEDEMPPDTGGNNPPS